MLQTIVFFISEHGATAERIIMNNNFDNAEYQYDVIFYNDCTDCFTKICVCARTILYSLGSIVSFIAMMYLPNGAIRKK